ncbi:MAG: VapE family protein, partial [Bacteroides sp.]
MRPLFALLSTKSRSISSRKLKLFITSCFLLAVRAYTHNEKFLPRMASFCATGNNRFFLTDDSGNRRWLPFYVNRINDLSVPSFRMPDFMLKRYCPTSIVSDIGLLMSKY